MTTLNDAILAATGGPTINDGLATHFGKTASESLQDAEYRFLVEGGAASGQLNDMWLTVLNENGFEGSINDAKLAFWKAGGNLIIPANEFVNSAWSGGSGSVGGADWVDPTSWDNGFWPPDEAINEGVFDTVNTRLHFEVVANRGYLTQALDGTPWIGQDVNLSVFIDEVTIGQGAPCIGISGDATTIESVGNSQTARRVSGVFNITGANITVRCGMGITSNGTAEFKLSRPQFTLGDILYVYQPT